MKISILLLGMVCLFSGCVTNEATDIGTDMAGMAVGGLIGYSVSDGKPLETALGVGLGYTTTQVGKYYMAKTAKEAEIRGFEYAEALHAEEKRLELERNQMGKTEQIELIEMKKPLVNKDGIIVDQEIVIVPVVK